MKIAAFGQRSHVLVILKSRLKCEVFDCLINSIVSQALKLPDII